jgi:hypothetical protein
MSLNKDENTPDDWGGADERITNIRHLFSRHTVMDSSPQFAAILGHDCELQMSSPLSQFHQVSPLLGQPVGNGLGVSGGTRFESG